MTTPTSPGSSYTFDLGPLKVNYTFDSDTTATFVVTDGGGLTADGHTETVEIQKIEIRPGVFLNSWREEGGATVNHVEDFENGILYSNVTIDGQLYRMTGTIAEA